MAMNLKEIENLIREALTDATVEIQDLAGDGNHYSATVMEESTKILIQKHIDNNDVCLFMKGTPEAPQCGFSMAVINMLKLLEVNFGSVNVLEDQNIREGIKVFSDWPTIPQLYIKKEFVGGCDIIKEMYENGELKKILDTKNINYKH